MACGLAHKESEPQRFRDAVACGQKYENPHFQHYCIGCGNRDTELCKTECWHGPTCHYEPSVPDMVRVGEILAQVLAPERGNPSDVGASEGPYGDTTRER